MEKVGLVSTLLTTTEAKLDQVIGQFVINLNVSFISRSQLKCLRGVQNKPTKTDQETLLSNFTG